MKESSKNAYESTMDYSPKSKGPRGLQGGSGSASLPNIH